MAELHTLYDGFARRLLATIRAELEQRALQADEESRAGNPWIREAWDGEDEPFVNEMCLLLLVWTRHQVERQLVSLPPG